MCRRLDMITRSVCGTVHVVMGRIGFGRFEGVGF